MTRKGTTKRHFPKTDKELLEHLAATCLSDTRAFMWGLWDLRDQCWYGTHAGPNAYPKYWQAGAAATILNQMLGRWTIRARIIFPDSLVVKDHVEARLTAEQALEVMGA